MANYLNSVDCWLKSQRGVSCKREWLLACLTWITQEEGGSNQPSLPSLQNSVYQQWLHTDLKECTTGCLPPEVFQSQAGKINGSFIVQIDSLINVGAAAYSQLEQIQGRELDEAEPPPTRHAYDLKPSRMLFVSLTDGCTSVQGMEYQMINQLSVDTPPGTKLLLQGSIKYRLGVLLLVGSHVTVLGGSVEELQKQNSEKRVLARALKNEALANESQTDNEVIVAPPQERHPQQDPLYHHVPHPTQQQEDQEEGQGQYHPQSGSLYQGPCEDVQPDDGQNEDLYTSFHDEDENQGRESRYDVDIPDWTQFCDFGGEGNNNTRNRHESNITRPSEGNYTIGTGEGNITRPSEDNYITGTGEENITRPSEDNYITGTGEGNITRPSNVTVLPVCRVFQEIAGKPGRIVYTKASVNKIEGELTRGSTDWSVGATLADQTGELSVVIGNKPIETLTGFTLAEFKARTIPTVQMRQGLLRCHKTLLSLNCIMEIQWNDKNRQPTVTRLLDV